MNITTYKCPKCDLKEEVHVDRVNKITPLRICWYCLLVKKIGPVFMEEAEDEVIYKI